MGLFDFLKNEKPISLKMGDKELSASKEGLAYTMLGHELYNAGNYIGAADAFSKSIALDKPNAAMHVIRGTAYEDFGNVLEAEKDFAIAVKLDPTDYLAAYRLGMIYSDRKDRVNAIKYLKLSYDNHPLDVPDVPHMGWSRNCIFFVGKQIIAHNLGTNLNESRLYEQAIPYFEHSIQIEPGYANAYFGLGAAIYNAGYKEEAHAYFLRAAKLGHVKASDMIVNWS